MVREMCQVDTGDAIALSVGFDKNSKFVSVGCSDAEIKVLSVDKAEIVSVLKAHEDAVNGVVINQENNAMYSISSDGTIRIWK
jgi:WD40 repeat protein